MKTSKYTEEQIVYALHQAEAGEPVVDVCRRMEISQQTFYSWKKKYGGLGSSELRRMKLEDENRKLKRLVADLSLDKHMLQEVIEKSSEACKKAGDCRLPETSLSDFGETVVQPSVAGSIELPI
jgi:putative transposase